MRIVNNDMELLDTGFNPWALDIHDRENPVHNTKQSFWKENDSNRYALVLLVFTPNNGGNGLLFEWTLRTYDVLDQAKKHFQLFTENRHVIDLR